MTTHLESQIRGGWAAARMAADKFEQIERTLMQQSTEKRTVEEIVEAEIGGELSTALSIYELKVDAANLIDQYSCIKMDGRSVDWEAVEYAGIPRGFFELCQQLADFEVRL